MTVDLGITGTLLEYAIRIERSMERLYHEFGRLFAEYPEIALFWERYANEESEHARYLEQIRIQLDPSRLSQPVEEWMLHKARICLEKVSKDRTGQVKTLEDALAIAMELENSEINAIFQFITENLSPEELRHSQNFLRDQIGEHATKLDNELPNPYKSRWVRQSILARRSL